MDLNLLYTHFNKQLDCKYKSYSVNIYHGYKKTNLCNATHVLRPVQNMFRWIENASDREKCYSDLNFFDDNSKHFNEMKGI